MTTSMTAVITCAVLESEIEHFARQFPHIVSVTKLPQGLHNEPPVLRRELQYAIDQVESSVRPETVVLGYGLCSRGVEGVKTTAARLVVARAHDCVTLLLGSKERYAAYVAEHPGTYWYSPGWNRHHDPPGERRYTTLLRQYTEQYGEDNAQFLMETEQSWFSTYDRATYVDLGVTDSVSDVSFTKECARYLGWKFDRLHGESSLVHDLLAGEWDSERFLVLEPGETIRLTADDRIIEAVPADED